MNKYKNVQTMKQLLLNYKAEYQPYKPKHKMVNNLKFNWNNARANYNNCKYNLRQVTKNGNKD